MLWPVVNGDLSKFARAREQMGQSYEVVATSRPLGLAHLYRHRLARGGGNGTDRQPQPLED